LLIFIKLLFLVEDNYNTNINLDNFELEEISIIINDFFVAMDDDFNTAKALVALNKILLILINKIRNRANEKEIVYLYQKIKNLGAILNLFFNKNSEDVLNELFKFYSEYLYKPKLTLEKINIEIEKIKNALEKKNYFLSDRIRGNLLDRGIKVMQMENKNIEWQFAFVEK